ncbi:MAG: hypothetical protein M1812_006387 [Candelaria pacifica]|nr:MAG: hypothetical protein M1812_006387 [Candelaria pacifica]
MVSTPNTITSSPHTDPAGQDLTSPHLPLPLPISKYSPSYPGPAPGANYHIGTIFTTYSCGHRTNECNWVANVVVPHLQEREDEGGDEGQNEGGRRLGVVSNKPEWKDANGKCASCCWRVVKVDGDRDSDVGEEEECLGEEGVKEDGEKDLKKMEDMMGEDVVEELIDDMLGFLERDRDELAFIDGIDRAIEDVELDWENAVCESRQKMIEAEDKGIREEKGCAEAEVDEKGMRAREKRKKSVVEGKMRKTVSDEDEDPRINQTAKETPSKETVDRDERRRKRQKDREVNEIVTHRLSSEEKRRKLVVDELVGRKKFVEAWNVMRGESLDDRK